MSKRVAILCAGQAGDCMTISSGLKYKKELWGEDCKITWFISKENMDLLKYQDIEVMEFPRGFGYPEMVKEENEKLIAEGKEPIWEDWQGLMDENNHLNLELAKNYLSLAEFDLGYFPAPHQMSVKQRSQLVYATCSKKVMDIPMGWEWHPVLMFSDEDRKMALDFTYEMRESGTKIICLELFAGSGQSKIESEQVRKVIDICKEVLSSCVFIFMSHKYLKDEQDFPEWLTNDDRVFFAKYYTVRQCALIVAQCDLFISVSSGISVAASCWENMDKPFKTIQFCGSEVCSTKELYHNRHFELVTHDDKILDDAYNEFNSKLIELLKTIK